MRFVVVWRALLLALATRRRENRVGVRVHVVELARVACVTWKRKTGRN